MTERLAAFTIEYRFLDGLHVITSHDLPGLYLAHADPRAVLANVPAAAVQLLQANEQLDCTVEPLAAIVDLVRRRPEVELGRRTFLVRVNGGDPA